VPDSVNLVKVFSATKFRHRDALGERVTTWIGAHPGIRIRKAVVSLTSGGKFHCLSIVLLCDEQPDRA